MLFVLSKNNSSLWFHWVPGFIFNEFFFGRFINSLNSSRLNFPSWSVSLDLKTASIWKRIIHNFKFCLPMRCSFIFKVKYIFLYQCYLKYWYLSFGHLRSLSHFLLRDITISVFVKYPKRDVRGWFFFKTRVIFGETACIFVVKKLFLAYKTKKWINIWSSTINFIWNITISISKIVNVLPIIILVSHLDQS